jgi:acetyl esterase/lipase
MGAKRVSNMKKIGFLSFGHWTPSAQSRAQSAADVLLQSIDLAVEAERLGMDGAYFRVHHFAQQFASPFSLLAAVGARTGKIEIGTAVDTRAEAEPYFTKSQVAGLVRSYLGATDLKNPLASPLCGDLSGLPPIRVQVGDDEVLLDDSRRYVERAVAAGVDARLDVWTTDSSQVSVSTTRRMKRSVQSEYF